MARKRTADKQHRWLSQVEVTGVVFSEPVLAEAAPAGFPNLDKKVLAQFYKAREIWNLPKGMLKDDGQAAWIQFIFDEILRLKNTDDWLLGATIPPELVVNLSEQQETLRPARVLVDEGTPVLLFIEVPRNQSLDRPWLQKTGRWKASPTTKLERLLRETGVELGLVTNGEAWRLLVASPSETASWITWTANTWADSPITLAAFRDLLGEERFFAGERENIVLELIRRSRERQLDVADQLGAQVREALGLLVHELDRVDAALAGKLLDGYSESEVFEAAVALIMRLLFLLFAEENGLLPHGTVAYDNAYGALHLLTELENQHRLAPEKLKHSYAAYSRILATTRLIHAGSVDPDIRVAAHGGRLFDPDCYAVLEGRGKDGGWPVDPPEPPRISDAVVRDVLRSLKYAKANGARQLVSYRTLAVEQIGHMYEGLLDRRVARAPTDSALFLLQGSSKVPEPEPLPAAEIEGLEATDLLKLLAKRTGRTRKTLKDLQERPENRVRLPDPGTDDAELLALLAPVQRFVVDRGAVRPGGLFVAQGKDRRSQGAHYTPPTLTEPIVRRTLEHQVYINVPNKPGLLQEPIQVKTPEELLDLKVCDPAMGSGAFLVQVVRYLSERLVDSWELRALEHPDDVLTMPFATPSEGGEDEAILPESREDRLVWAKRYVAEHCVYGVDVNRHAVEMAKLSLWIATASRDRPFTFLDHALKHGDSLVGLSKDQIQAFTWKELKRDWGPLFKGMSESIDEACESRSLLHDLSAHDYQGKLEYHSEAEGALQNVRVLGDAVVAAFFEEGKDRERDGRRLEYQHAADQWRKGRNDDKVLTAAVEKLRRGDPPILPFHWEIEFPEVFLKKSGNPGFNAMLGNPPFLGGKRIGTVHGSPYASFCSRLKRGAKGAADLCTYFLLRANDELLGQGGSAGFIVTNSISEGATRKVGLREAVSRGAAMFSATTSQRWPGKASVIISVVHFARTGAWHGDLSLNQRRVTYLSTYLDEVPCEDPPSATEVPFECFGGVGLYGDGFILTADELHELEGDDSKTREVVRRYLIGDDVNNVLLGQPSRWVIDFGERDEQAAAQYSAAFKRVKRLVKPKRDKQTKQVHESRYWIHWDRRTEAFSKLAPLRHVFVRSIVSNLHIVAPAEKEWVLSKDLAIFATDKPEHFAVLQSLCHELWARRFSTTMKADMRYSISGAFANFPFPVFTEEVASLGGRLLALRHALANGQSWTLRQMYQRLHDPECQLDEIVELRKTVVDLDRAVCTAYGLQGVCTARDFRIAEWLPIPELRYTCTPEARGQILNHLLSKRPG